MAISKTFRYEDIWGKTPIKIYDVTLDSSYPTDGYTAALGFSPEAFGLKSFLAVKTIAIKAAASGVVAVEYDFENSKLMAFRVATFTPAGTIAKPTFTITKGAILASSELGLSADATNATINNNTIASTLTLLAANSPVNAPAFTGTAQGQVALAEVSNAVDLSTVIVRLLIMGGNVEN